ncbi:hypothetical protein ACFSL4_15685 [Streptomyces caeni]|uniref:Uncharacterized protein n=1 Tax=Streptomyces caeni TaxID=2307231 RepID=A0ABW4IQG4_9ACTN
MPPSSGADGTRVVLDGCGPDAGGVVRLADVEAVPVVPPKALGRTRRAWRTAQGWPARAGCTAAAPA